MLELLDRARYGGGHVTDIELHDLRPIAVTSIRDGYRSCQGALRIERITVNTHRRIFECRIAQTITESPYDLITFNKEYNAYIPDFYAIRGIAQSLETGEPFTLEPENKTYAIEISNDTYEYARKRWELLRKKRMEDNSFSEDDETEFNLLADIVSSFRFNHKISSPEDDSL